MLASRGDGGQDDAVASVGGGAQVPCVPGEAAGRGADAAEVSIWSDLLVNFLNL